MIRFKKQDCKDQDRCRCAQDGSNCWEIIEFIQNDELKYVVLESSLSFTHGTLKVYNTEGNLICGPESISNNSLDSTRCDNILRSTKVRSIWKENVNDYH